MNNYFYQESKFNSNNKIKLSIINWTGFSNEYLISGAS